jgi:hypothetical protein
MPEEIFELVDQSGLATTKGDTAIKEDTAMNIYWTQDKRSGSDRKVRQTSPNGSDPEELVTTAAYTPVLNQGDKTKVVSLVGAPPAWPSGAPSSRAGQRPTHNVRFARLPVAFEPNHGQTAAEVTYLARCRGYTVFLTSAGATVRFSARAQASPDERSNLSEAAKHAQPQTFSLRFLGANAETAWEGSRQLPGVVHYLIGSDPTRWQRNIPTFAQVQCRGGYPGITVVYHSTPDGQLQVDFLVDPGADPGVIRLAIDGAEQMELTPLGDLTLQSDHQDVCLRKPVIYQEDAGGRTQIEGSYELTEDGHVRFTVGRYDAARQLVIDPVLVYSTYLGGSGSELGTKSIAVDATGHAYIAGRTESLDFPTQNPLQPGHGGSFSDGFVAKLDPSGTALVYSTYLGGGSVDECTAIALDTVGNVYVSGSTASQDFPTTPGAFQGTHAGGSRNVFVAKLNAAGSNLVFSTYLGGGQFDHAHDIAVDALGAVYVTGETRSADFPTLNPLQPDLAGGLEAFVTKLAPDGQALVFSTFLGGTATDRGQGIAVDSDGAVYVAGYTRSDDFPTVNALQPTLGGESDAFVAKLTPDGAALEYCTYLGGSGNEASDGGSHVVVDQGQAIVLTSTFSDDFPTVNALQPASAGDRDVALAKLAADGGSLIFSTYLGGPGEEEAHGLALDNQGNIIIAGFANAGFPMVNAIQEDVVGAGGDAFVSILTGDGSILLFSTFLGGSDAGFARSVAVDPQGRIYVTGVTRSRDFPTTAGAFQETLGGIWDAFVAKLSVQPDFRFEYAAKLLCGVQRDPEDMRLAPGFYATTINIHNPHNEPVVLFKKLALTFPPGEQRPGQIMPIATDRLGPDEALAVDCVDIRNRLFPEGLPTPYIEGFVVIQSAQSLDVTAVYSTAAVDERGTVTSHSSIHVEQVRERDRARVIETATDLLIRKEAIVRGHDTTIIINDGIISSSATTALVRYRIHVDNLGPAAAQNVVVSDTLQVQPGTLISVPQGGFSATHGGVWSLGQVTQSSAELEATIPVLLATEHAVLEFMVVVQSDFAALQAELTNTASVTSDAAELDPSNNSVVVKTSVKP